MMWVEGKDGYLRSHTGKLSGGSESLSTARASPAEPWKPPRSPHSRAPSVFTELLSTPRGLLVTPLVLKVETAINLRTRLDHAFLAGYNCCVNTGTRLRAHPAPQKVVPRCPTSQLPGAFRKSEDSGSHPRLH